MKWGVWILVPSTSHCSCGPLNLALFLPLQGHATEGFSFQHLNAPPTPPASADERSPFSHICLLAELWPQWPLAMNMTVHIYSRSRYTVSGTWKVLTRK